jgi:hypothetical protein
MTRKQLLILCLTLLFPLYSSAAPQPPVAALQPASLPEAPHYPDHLLPPEPVTGSLVTRSTGLSRTGSFGTLDLDDRDLVSAFYQSVYGASKDTAMGWDGDVAGCVAGDTSANYKDAVLIRINWYRAMAGIPSDVTLFTGAGSYSDKAQDAALMMSRNNALSHSPPPSWACYSSSGGEAAGSSNLSLGHNGWDAVDGQMADSGGNNSAAGHRRWILYPQTRLMGTGDIPFGNGYSSSNDLWVFDSHYSDARPATRDGFVAWPPPGYTPYQVVPIRWSLSYPAADFSTASVNITRSGQPVDVTLEPIVNGYGENTLVWVPDGLNPASYPGTWPPPQEETSYDVEIWDVRIGGSYTDFSYQVTIFDPASQDITPLTVSGPGQVGPAGAAFGHDTLDFGEAYRLREIRFLDYQGGEGAEDGGTGILDGTNWDYELVTAQASAGGTHAFHLAHTTPTPQRFELDRSFILESGSSLQFSSRLGWATTDQIVRVQISIDDGLNWRDLYTRAGNDTSGEGGFTSHTIPLSDHAGRVARFRVIYELGGSYYPQSSSGVGFYIDDIEITAAREMGSIVLTDLSTSGSFAYLPAAAGEYGLQVQASPWTGFPGLAWGPVHSVSVSAASGCNGEEVTISSGFEPGAEVVCTATLSITTSGIVSIPTDASVRFEAPMIRLEPGFHADAGALFSAGQQ